MKFFKLFTFFVAAVIFASSVTLQTSKADEYRFERMSIEKAYQIYNKTYTPYDFSKSTLSYEDRTYLDLLFTYTDQIVITRVQAYVDIRDGRFQIEPYNIAIDMYVEIIKNTTPPSKVQEAYTTLIKAIETQKEFVNHWAKMSPGMQKNILENIGQDSRVRSAHKDLLKAYNLLMQAYSNESAYNKGAFYNHLCMLDFI